MTDKLRELAERWAVRMDRNAKYATALMPDDSAELAEIIRACISILNAEGDGGVAGDNVQCSHCSAIFTRRDWTVDNFDRPIPRCQFCGSSGAPQPVRTTETHPARSGVVSDEDVEAALKVWNDAPALGRDEDDAYAMRAVLEHFAKGANWDMQRDAARYRWLRKNCKREWYSDMPHNKGAPSLDVDFSATGHDLDKAIDAAMEAK